MLQMTPPTGSVRRRPPADGRFRIELTGNSIEKGVMKYHLDDVNLKFTLGHGVITGDATFSSESKFKGDFYAALLEEMKKQGVLEK
ncbi:hypothetical protein [Photobacterium sp. 1_MG-2023]|uniref:hypothetical protein n=1 Tax=Photobacterium sp. 1_MG-2023 TaxID=3062646 RepID=UPI0026E2FB4C|nr:hypothetical protein [Photobacterium sp. 1_MG-2023]MDO6708826.1 hypothetical protein [Photobacterium sp. 1_MG-2023]